MPARTRTWTDGLAATERSAIFGIVRASVWADGRLTADELSAARGAAIALDVLSDPRVPGSLARPEGHVAPVTYALPGPARRVAFALAAWIAWVDGDPCGREQNLLAALQRALELDDDEVTPIVREVARSVSGIRRAGPETMSAEDWAIEIDGLLAWAALGQ